MTYIEFIGELLKYAGVPALVAIVLKSSFDTKLENLKSDLNYLKGKENFKFTKLHEIRLKVLAKTHQLLNENLSLLEEYTSPIKIIPHGKTFDESEREFSLKYKEAHNKFIRYFNQNAIYFSEDMEELIFNYVTSSAKIFDTYDLKVQYPKSDAQIMYDAVNVYKKIRTIVYPLKKEIEIKFRQLLGE